jgi:hypothetical protein
MRTPDLKTPVLLFGLGTAGLAFGVFSPEAEAICFSHDEVDLGAHDGCDCGWGSSYLDCVPIGIPVSRCYSENNCSGPPDGGGSSGGDGGDAGGC